MRIQGKINSNLRIDFDITEHITVLRGDSGIGKTYLAEMLDELVKNSDEDDELEITGLPSRRLDTILVCLNEKEVANIKGVEDKLIIIDKYDIFKEDTYKIIWDEVKKFKNTWIIISRSGNIPNYGLSRDSIVTLDRSSEGNIITLSFRHYY